MIILQPEFVHAMLDLETLSTKANAVISQIGACVFNEDIEYPTLHKHISISSCLHKGLVVEEATILWWMKQSDEVRAAFQKSSIGIKGALIAFQDWCRIVEQEAGKPIALWGNGASFDNAILSTAYARCHYRQPWQFWNDKCYRTVKNQFPEVPKVVPEIAHNALSDAEAQAEHLVNIANYVSVDTEQQAADAEHF